jgi:hypothetical protein
MNCKCFENKVFRKVLDKCRQFGVLRVEDIGDTDLYQCSKDRDVKKIAMELACNSHKIGMCKGISYGSVLKSSPLL